METPDLNFSALEQRHRDAMLDLVLVWAALDGAMSMLVANIRGQEWADAAPDVRKLRGSAKLHETIGALKTVESGQAAADALRKINKKYEKHSKIRDFVAHSRCVGISTSEPERIIFLTFARVGDGLLACDQVHLKQFDEAITWGHDLLELIFRLTHKS